MKNATRFILALVPFILLFSCPSAPDPLKDLPQTEYEQAQRMRARITALNFAQYAPEDFKAGEDQFKAGEANYKKDNQAAKVSFDAAIVSYRQVIVKGVTARSKESEEEIDLAKQKADEIKAAVAVEEEYKDANATFERARALANEDSWEEAETLFKQAKTKYENVYKTAKIKKDRAETQYDTTNKDLESIRAAQEQIDKGSEKANP